MSVSQACNNLYNDFFPNMSVSQACNKLYNELVKVYYNYTISSSIAGGTDEIVSISLPSSYTKILQIIPIMVQVTATWESFAIINGLYDNNKISIHTIGSASQAYKVSYCILYLD